MPSLIIDQRGGDGLIFLRHNDSDEIHLYSRAPFWPYRVNFRHPLPPKWSHRIESDTTDGKFFRQLANMGFDIEYNPIIDPFLPVGYGTVWLTDDALMTLKLLVS